MNTGSEGDIVGVFCQWLRQQGWEVQTEVEDADVVAVRGDERVIGEAKGVTTEPGLDVDTMYGQLLRRMTERAGTRYAVVVPEKLITAASRVPKQIRELLKIDLYGIDSDDLVRQY